MIEVKRYDSSMKVLWDEFITVSRIDSFILFRDFMDYHADRFTDCSLMVFRKGKLDSLMPGNIVEDTFYTHQGLTYGGIILSKTATAVDVLNYFKEIAAYLKQLGIKKVVYKSIPIIYHKFPSQEDLYALYKLNAIRIGCNISSVLYQNAKLPFVESRKSGLRKALNNQVVVNQTSSLADFWAILENNLLFTHGVKPVHSLAEINLLQTRFPENIITYTCSHNDETIAGCVLFVMESVVRVQYISANEVGKKLGALDLLFHHLINEKYTAIPYFDFGPSTEKMGEILNENLIFQKEGFGGRGLTYDIYSYTI